MFKKYYKCGVCVNSKEKYNSLMEELESLGYSWGIGKPTSKHYWDEYKENTVIFCDTEIISYGSQNYLSDETDGEYKKIIYYKKKSNTIFY